MQTLKFGSWALLFAVGCGSSGSDPKSNNLAAGGSVGQLAVGGSAVGGSTVGGSAVGGSAVGGSAVGGSAVDGGSSSAGTAVQGGTGGAAPAPSGAGRGGASNPVTPDDPCVDGGKCSPGSWLNVTPAAVSLSVDTGCNGCNFGVQDVVADPVRRGDLYAFICYQGVWKSIDYGLTWVKVSKGMNGAHLDSGRPWTAAIDPNTSRDPNTPPALYTVNGYGDLMGVYKSVDGGVNFTHYDVNNTQAAVGNDVYSLDVDPYDSDHLIAGFHSTAVSESKDGGVTWKTITVPNAVGVSPYVWFVLSGSPATTSGTWLTQAQWDKNDQGMWLTTNSGASWTQVLPSLEHGHGAAQLYQDGKGAIYASGSGHVGDSIWRSTDYGKTWQAAVSGDVTQNAIFGTPNFVYATLPVAFTSGQQQHLQRSPASDGVNWVDWAPIAPAGMSNGAKRAAVTFDGKHYVIVTGNWLAGIWRYIE